MERLNDCGITCYEKVSLLDVKWLLEQEQLHSDQIEDSKVKDVLTSMLKGYKISKCFKTVYKTSKQLGNYGRMYPWHYATPKTLKYGGLCSLSRAVRGFLADRHNIDIDIKRCHWYIVKYLFYLSDGLNNDLIDKFLDNYDKIVQFIIKNNEFIIKKEDECEHDTDIDKAKKTIFSILYTSTDCLNDTAKKIIDNCIVFRNIHKQMYNIVLPSLLSKYHELVGIVRSVNKSKTDRWNMDGKILSHILQHIEKLLIIDITQFFQKEQYKISAIIHDGFLLQKDNKFDESVLDKCQEHIKRTWSDCMEIKLVIKPFLTGIFPEVPDDYSGTTDEDKSNYAILCEKMLTYASENKLRKDISENVYRQSTINPLHYTRMYTDDDNERTDFTKIIEDVFEGDPLIDSNPAFFNQVKTFLETRNKREFRDIVYDKDLIGFNNCVLNLRTLEITMNSDILEDDNRIVRHCIDNRLDVLNLTTKEFDDAIMYQVNDPDALQWLYILIGRLFFAPFNDYLHAVAFIKGQSSTFKSVLLFIISKMFRPGCIGTIQSTQEQVFGMEGLVNKEVILAYDLPEDMVNVIKPDLFKGMYSGEPVNVPRKNKLVKTVTKWKVPAVLVSQFHLNYSDDGGAISKRLALFIFDTKIPEELIDTSLGDRIVTNELPSILYKSVKLYREFLDSNDCRTFEYIRPEYFKNTIKAYMENNNVVFNFLKQEPTISNGIEYSIEYGSDYFVSWAAMENQYKHWCKYKNIKHVPIKSDNPTFRQLNLKKQEIKTCKMCGNIHSNSCCGRTSRDTRKKTLVITGIKFVSKEIDRVSVDWD